MPGHGRPVKCSKSEAIELVLPNDTNQLGVLLGGRLMHWIDLAGALAAHRHSNSHAVTASMDHIDFLVSVPVGDFVILQSSVNRVFHTSMEVGVKVLAENYLDGSRRHVASAYLTFVALNREKIRIPICSVIPETEDEKRRYEEALRRRKNCQELHRHRSMSKQAQQTGTGQRAMQAGAAGTAEFVD
jgi:acyl-CoA hydrolase